MANDQSSSIPTAEQYDQQELTRAYKHIADITFFSQLEKKEHQAVWEEALTLPDLICERINWLLDGNYGRGSQIIALNIIHSPRMNRVAALSQLIACFEWLLESGRARASWKKLSKTQQATLDRAILNTINDYEARHE